MQIKEIDNLLYNAISAALKAAKEILEVYNTEDFKIKIKEDKSPLTLADQKAHQVICQMLERTNLPILSEEGKDIDYETRRKWEYFWLVDPLDGTKEFIKRNGEFTVNIALIRKNEPIGGVIYVPDKNTLYFSNIQSGAYKNEKVDFNVPMPDFEGLKEVSVRLPLGKPSHYTAVGSRSHMSAETEEYFQKLKAEHGEIEIISKGSSLKLCMVAEGKANIYPRFAPTMEWDTAAGHAIVLGAGGKVTQTDGKTPVIYNKRDLLNPWFIVFEKATS